MKRGRYLLIAVVVIACHQFARMALFGSGKPIAVLPFFNLVEVWNRGISFGMFNDLAYGQWLLSGMAIIITLILLRWLFYTDDRFTAAALGLIIGGAVGNTIDRLRFGAVADYLDFHAFGYHWPAFNFTDAAIFLGVVMLLIFKKTLPTPSIRHWQE
jgi:signal peptidase II